MSRPLPVQRIRRRVLLPVFLVTLLAMAVALGSGSPPLGAGARRSEGAAGRAGTTPEARTASGSPVPIEGAAAPAATRASPFGIEPTGFGIEPTGSLIAAGRAAGTPRNAAAASPRSEAEGGADAADPYHPADLRFLDDLIASNGLREGSSSADRDDADGRLTALEVGHQVWRGGRLVAFGSGPHRYASFGYDLTVLPASIAGARALRLLDLSSNHLTALPDEVTDLVMLEELILYGNRLESLPAGIDRMVSLRRVVLSGNALRRVPGSVGGLASLASLYLNDNPLESLPESVGDLHELVILDVSRAALTALPESLAALPRLAHLHLAGNPLYCGAPGPGPAFLRDGSIGSVHGLGHRACATALR